MEPEDLDRFVIAQDDGRTYDRAITELSRGRKTSHWMWFVFPQLLGLGASPTSVFYGIRDADHATRYLAHPVLGPRLRDAVDAVLAITTPDAERVFGSVDAAKLRSCVTLFGAVAPDETRFTRLLDGWFDGTADPQTLRLLQAG